MFVVGSVWMLSFYSKPASCTDLESARRRTPVTITFHQHPAARRSFPNSRTTDPDKGRRDGGADALLIIRRRVVVHILPIWLDNKAGSGRRARTSPLSFSDRKVIRKSEFVNCVVIQTCYLYSRQGSVETTHTPAPRLKIRFLCKLGYASKAKR